MKPHKVIPHGVYKYTREGCRCHICRMAKKEYVVRHKLGIGIKRYYKSPKESYW